MFSLWTSQSFSKGDDFPSTLSRIGIESAPDVGVHVAILSPSMALMPLLVEVGRLHTKKTDPGFQPAKSVEVGSLEIGGGRWSTLW